MKLYIRYFLIQLKSQMQYKVSFFMTLTGQLITSFSAFLGIFFLMDRFHAVDGFTVGEVMLCFAVVLMAFSIAECFARGFDHFAAMLGNGEFDRILVRPRNVVLQVLGSKIDFTRLGRFAQAVVMFCVLIPTCGVAWTPGKIAVLALMIVGGAVTFSGLFVIYAAICFFSTEGIEFMNIFTDGGRQFGAYPLSIYGEGILRFYTFVIPLALCQYYPMLYLTGRTEEAWYGALPILAVVFLLPCFLLWKVGIRHYKSTGS